MRIGPKMVERTGTRKGHGVLYHHPIFCQEAKQSRSILWQNTPEAPLASLVFSQQFVECFVLTANQVIFALQKATKNHKMDE